MNDDSIYNQIIENVTPSQNETLLYYYNPEFDKVSQNSL